MGRDEGGRTDVLGVECIDANERTSRQCSQTPFSDLTDDGELAFVEVVDDARVEADV